MNAGFEIKNNNNRIIIDADYKNLTLLRKVKGSELNYVGTKKAYSSPDTSFNVAELYAYEIPLNNDEDVLIGLGDTLTVTNNNLSLGKWVGDDKLYLLSSKEIANLGVYIYFFGFSEASGSDFGVQVFNEKGTLVYDSGNKYLQVKTGGQVGDYKYSPTYNDMFLLNFSSVPTAWSCSQMYWAVSDGYLKPRIAYGEGLTASAMRNLPCPMLIGEAL